MSNVTKVNKFSRLITQNIKNAPAQAMLNAIGLSKKDMDKAQIGVGAVWYESNPCNSHLNKLVSKVKQSFNINYQFQMYNRTDNYIPFAFNTPGVSDGISMGTFGMKYSLPSRELIADNFESICMAHHYDALIGIPGCDKNMPGIAMAMCRLNRPSIMIYGGSMEPGLVDGEESDIVTVFEGGGKLASGEITKGEMNNIIENSCSKKCGACSGLYTANTMAIMLEVMGLTLPNSSSNPTGSREKFDECIKAVTSIKKIMTMDLKPLDILTKDSFINAIKMLYITGGSTNGIIHLLAIAKEANIDLKLEDFNELNDIPILLNMKPHGKHMMYHLHQIGGTSALIEYLIQNGILNGNCMTVTGELLRNNVHNAYHYGYHRSELNILDFRKKWEDVIFSLDKPFKADSHINILKGNLAPKGCISKIYDKQQIYKQTCVVYDSEDDMIDALNDGDIHKDNIIVIRGQGETTGCPEMLKPTSALIGYFGSGNVPPLLTDGRFSGGSRGILVAHLEDMYKEDSITGLIYDGDEIEIDLTKNSINLLVPKEQLRTRNINYYLDIQKSRPKYKGTLGKFCRHVGDIDSGYLMN